MKKLLVVAILFLSVTTAQSATLYVDKDNVHEGTCSDSSTYAQAQSWATPYCTIQKAASVVIAGDIVIVANGTYGDTNSDNKVVNMTRSGSSSNYITFKSENKWDAIIDCGNPDTTSATYGLFLNTVNYIKIEDFEMKDCTDKAVSNNAGGTYISITGNKFHHNNLGIRVGGSSARTTIDSNIFYDNYDNGVTDPGDPQTHGIYLGTSSYNVITNNIFYDFNKPGWPIHLYGGTVSNSSIINNTFDGYNTKTGHIILASTITSTVIQNNISYDPLGYFLRYSNPNVTSVTIKNNLVYLGSLIDGTGCSDPDITCAGNITGQNPDFVNLAGNDYHLTAESTAAIDAGLDTNAPDYDHDGVARANPPEIGAYEYGTTADTEDPTTPADVVATATGETSMSVAFTGSTDNVAVTGYNVYRCTGDACSPSVILYSGLAGTPFIDSGLTAATTYCYSISAYDAAGNESALSTAGCQATDAASSAVDYDIIFGISATKTDCTDFAAANALTVGDYQTWKMMYDFTSIYLCVDSTDAAIVANCSRDGACYADDAIKLRFSPSNNFTDETDIEIVIAMNNEKQDSSVGLSLAKDVPAYSIVTTGVGHTYIWMKMPISALYTSIPREATIWGFQACEINGSTQGYLEKCVVEGTATFGGPSVFYLRML